MAAPPLFFGVPMPPLLQGAGTAAAALDPAALPVPARRRHPRPLRRAARAPAGPCAAHTEQSAPATGLAAPCVPACLSAPREIRVWAPAHAHSPVWPPQGAAAAPTVPWRAPAPHASDAWPPYGAVAAPTTGSVGAWPPLAPTVPAPATAVLAMARVPAPTPNAPAWPAFSMPPTLLRPTLLSPRPSSPPCLRLRWLRSGKPGRGILLDLTHVGARGLLAAADRVRRAFV
ncbi:vegetative cell wall protein gp1-like [Panicum virgatum]|uniref:vegetative cell wall protein gp1-like n=1 Tax=Panicum virgatum TaxID=38727 RepID=UPI0019D643CC|nr:vegetative cell wall protein gp1-like [Panicum virgatum]